ncbi:MAG: hypothetical protein ACUVUQ_01440 [Thermodesulfovibrionales bacterium]
MGMISTIFEASKSDDRLAKLLENVQEYAQLYLIAKQRQKGCDGMGEVATLKEEFVYNIEEMIRYCKEKNYLTGDITYEIDSIALGMKGLKND